MIDLDLLQRLAQRHLSSKPGTRIPELLIGRLSASPRGTGMLYEPMICLVLRGAKRIQTGDQFIDYGAGQNLVSAVTMPVTARIIADRQHGDYLSLVLKIDPLAVANLALDLGVKGVEQGNRNFGVVESDPLLLDAWRRLLELLDRPDEIGFLSPLIQREILYRMFRGSQGHLLAQVSAASPKVRQIRACAARIRSNYVDSSSVEDLAASASMSVTTFHRHFKEVMGMSPLQFRKVVRLHEARGRLTIGASDAASVAYAVGYESPSQFSREYKRLFGRVPSQERANALRQ